MDSPAGARSRVGFGDAPVRGEMRGPVHPRLQAMTDGLRSHIEDPGPMGKGFAADMIGGGSVRYLNKLARGEQMDAMDYFIPGLELPGGAMTAAAKKGGEKVAGAIGELGAQYKRGPVRGEQVDLGRRGVLSRMGTGAAAIAGAGMIGKEAVEQLGKRGLKTAAKEAPVEMAGKTLDDVFNVGRNHGNPAYAQGDMLDDMVRELDWKDRKFNPATKSYEPRLGNKEFDKEFEAFMDEGPKYAGHKAAKSKYFDSNIEGDSWLTEEGMAKWKELLNKYPKERDAILKQRKDSILHNMKNDGYDYRNSTWDMASNPKLFDRNLENGFDVHDANFLKGGAPEYVHKQAGLENDIVEIWHKHKTPEARLDALGEYAEKHELRTVYSPGGDPIVMYRGADGKQEQLWDSYGELYNLMRMIEATEKRELVKNIDTFLKPAPKPKLVDKPNSLGIASGALGAAATLGYLGTQMGKNMSRREALKTGGKALGGGALTGLGAKEILERLGK